MTDKKMKSSQIKKIIVECRLKQFTDTKEFDVDSDVFDDFIFEAATRYVQQHVIKENAKISPILTVFEKKDIRNYENQVCINSYYAIINAGFHKKAEIMRKNFINISGIDLQKETIKSQSNGQSGDNKRN